VVDLRHHRVIAPLGGGPGRRVYVEYKLDDRGGRLAEELETADLRPGQTYSELGDDTGVV
jgi:hypothetical protein